MRISIIGGGITGLTTALALNKLGIKCKVYEQSAELREVGAGIWLQPNALKVLDWIGIGGKLRDNGIDLNRVEVTNKNLRPIKEISSDTTQDEAGNKIIAIHRGKLQSILFEALPNGVVHLGESYVDHTIESKIVKVQFQHSRIETDILIGADGINSKVRNMLFPQSTLRDSKQVCYRGVSKVQLPNELKHKGREAWGKNMRFGFSQISESETYWFAVVDSVKEVTTKNHELQKDLKIRFGNFAPIVKEIIEHTPADQIIQGDLMDLKRLSTWHKGPVCLLGDAGHATTPNMGQGAGQGIEDAYYFSNMLKVENNYTTTFEKFEASRRKKVDYVVNNSWRFGKMAHSTVAQPIIKLLMKITPETVMKNQMLKLYSIDSFN